MIDVVILGGGMAGLSLARHLLLETDLEILLLERRRELPPARQKVGESTVQLAGYYFSKVLDLEQHLHTEQLMKYNLRFYWPARDGDNRGFESYAQSYIRDFSNVASYQLDRNRFEGHLLEEVSRDPRFAIQLGVSRLEIDLAESGDGPHRVRFRAAAREHAVAARWVVDATGRGRALSRRLSLDRACSIDHGSTFWWVDGLVDVEKLTELTRREVRLHRGRRHTGHLPSWLATNHFMAEGAWFWVIPLRGKTSLGLVYDPAIVPREEVSSVTGATNWVCRKFPLFARDLPYRQVVGRGGFRRFSYDCVRTISPGRWAITGEAGRFSDPLYSPGSDLIAVHNTLIVDAIRGDTEAAQSATESLASKCAAYEQLMRAAFSAYEASYVESYDALGDQEAQGLKYVWELAVYFAFYVFPFINDLFTERRFRVGYLRAFARLGPLNQGLQRLLSAYFQWKKERGLDGAASATHFDFTTVEPLARAREGFLEVGLAVGESRQALTRHLENLEELALFVNSWIAAAVVGDRAAIDHRAFVEGLDPRSGQFEPGVWRERWRRLGAHDARAPLERYPWTFDWRRAELPTDVQRRAERETPAGAETSAPCGAAA